MREGATFRGNLLALITDSAHRDSTLPTRGYCWKRDEGRKEFPDEAPPHALTFAINMIIYACSEFVLKEEEISLGSGGLK
jgi:hypothetical protein